VWILLASALALASAAGGAIAGAANHWVTAFAIVGLVAGLVLAAREYRAARKERVQELRRSLVVYPPQTVANTNPYVVGVRMARREKPGPDGGKPPYVVRAVDRALRAQLHSRSLVVLSGPKEWGKTRTLYEAVLKVLGNATLLAPVDSEALSTLLEHLPELSPGPKVIWLDDAIRYEGVLTEPFLQQLRTVLGDQPNRAAVVATLTTPGEPSPGGATPRDLAARFRRRPGCSIFDVRLEEDIRARHPAYSGADFSVGIGRWFLAADRIHDAYQRLADEDPLACDVVQAAVDWIRCGGGKAGIPEDVLCDYLRYGRQYKSAEEVAANPKAFGEGTADTSKTSKEDIVEAIRRATSPIPRAGVGLLTRSKRLSVTDDQKYYSEPWLTSYEADDELVAIDNGEYSAAPPRPVPPAIWAAAISNRTVYERIPMAHAALDAGPEYDALVQHIAGRVPSRDGEYLLGTLRHAQADRADDPGERRALLQLALVHYENWYEHGHPAEALIAKANALNSLGRTTEAVGMLRPIADYEPPAVVDYEPRAAVALGHLLATRDTWQEALAYFRRALADGHLEVAQNFGGVVFAFGPHGDSDEIREAIMWERMAVAEGLEWNSNLAVLLNRAGEHQEHERVLRAGAESGEVYCVLALALRGDSESREWMDLLQDDEMQEEVEGIFVTREEARAFADELSALGYHHYAATWRELARDSDS
jgi:tetratricopeptide (TPR) repeat protein